MKRKFYLAYGANTNKGAMSLRCPGAVFIAPYTLHNMRLVFRGVADVVDAKGVQTDAALWTITAADEAALDVFEGFPRLYVKRYVKILVEGVKQRGMMYVMRTPLERQALPFRAYVDCMLEGYAQCSLDKQQILDAIHSIELRSRNAKSQDLVLPQGTKPHQFHYKKPKQYSFPVLNDNEPPRTRIQTEAERRRAAEGVKIITPNYLKKAESAQATRYQKGQLPAPPVSTRWPTAMERAFYREELRREQDENF